LVKDLRHKGWKTSLYTHFATPQPCATLTKHIHLTQVFILPFSNTERGNKVADTSFVGIRVMISCFYSFYLPSLESTQEARVAFGYRLEQLLRFLRALQTSRVHPELDVRTLSMNHFFNFRTKKKKKTRVQIRIKREV